MQSTTQAALDTTGTLPLVEASQPGRLISLDVFRGLTVIGMLLVNFPGDWNHYITPLKHMDWDGCRPADLVFPSFLFMVGVSLTYALSGARRNSAGHGRVVARVARRALVLCLMGMLIDLLPRFYFTSFRIPGVLQRIGLVFFFGSVLFLRTSWRTQLWVLLGLLVGYNLLMQLVPVPGIGPANLNKATDLGAWLDQLVFTKRHLFDDQRGYDPEGLLSTLPAIGTGIMGMLAGQWLRRPAPDAATKTVWLFVAAAAAIGAGLIWNSWFPINKALWTSSFVLYSGGMALAALALLYWLCDVQGYRRWATPALWFGVNAITVYFLSEAVYRLLDKLRVGQGEARINLLDWLYKLHFAPLFGNPFVASIAWALTYLLIWTLVVWWMYRRGIVLKV